MENNLAAELKSLAENVKDKFNIDYTDAGVKHVDDYINSNRQNFTDESRERIIWNLGAFLGECIIANYGGTWQQDKELNSIGIHFSDQNKAFPISKVAKQIDNGEEDSILSFYRAIPVVFKMNEPPKPWYKFW